MAAEHAVAFAMGTHGRLGAASPVRCLAGEEGLLRMIAGRCRRWVSGAAGREEGVVRLLGGGTCWSRCGVSRTCAWIWRDRMPGVRMGRTRSERARTGVRGARGGRLRSSSAPAVARPGGDINAYSNVVQDVILMR